MTLVSLRLPRSDGPPAPPPLARTVTILGSTGFRPFFLLAALFAAAAVPLWLLVLQGRVVFQVPGGALFWHTHEMVFGYTIAVIAGFLLTAVARWTDRDTASGPFLHALAAVWLAGRVVMLLAGHLPGALVALVDLSFLPLLAVAVGRPIFAARNRRNYVMVGLLGGLWGANLGLHLEALGILPGAAAWGLRLALNLVTLMMLIIGARVIPMFTRNAVGDPSIESVRSWNVATAVGAVGLLAADLASAPAEVQVVLGAGTAVSAVGAARRWGTRASLRNPMLWVLHVGYFWIPVALLLRALYFAGVPLAHSTSVHALTAGAIGTLTIGMMARVTLGHSGRAIATSPITTACFVAITLAALFRVALPELAPAFVTQAWLFSGIAWTAAFVGYAAHFGPMLLKPRADGKPG